MYTLLEGVLYRKVFSHLLLQCLSPSEAEYVLREIHEGICGDHLGGKLLAQKIFRQVYYWPKVQKDAQHLVHMGDSCQRYAQSSVKTPQTNGQAKVMNKKILMALKKKVGEAKGAWLDELLKILWALRTSPHTAIGETIFSLVYNMETVIFAEIVARYYNSKVKNKQFQVGDLVLRNIEVSFPASQQEKMALSWEGPYKVIEKTGYGTYKLAKMEGMVLP
ncbi:Retrotransposable element Tf2 [Gossypium australe]|uniref:Retrotransposable element Tf2 n=1 Tax=Gossypium australe TaxID=47621 RepID=A0A5B6UWQ6_9ROSI|nr:Retrotransposable element Tf2 [Gossypium australe]